MKPKQQEQISLSPLKQNSVEYQTLVEKVSQSYKCEWTDDVHESYGMFVKQTQLMSQEINEVYNKSDLIQKEINELKLELMIKKADVLCAEAKTI